MITYDNYSGEGFGYWSLDLHPALLHKSISGQAPPNPSRGYATAAV